MRFLLVFLVCAACGGEAPAPPEIDRLSIDLTEAGAQTFAAGRSLQGLRLFTRAEQAYRQALDDAPSNPQYHYYLGAVLHAQSRFKEAQTQFEKALEIKPDYCVVRLKNGGIPPFNSPTV